jgi:hypothetical protein
VDFRFVKISCLMVTEGRFEQFKTSVLGYCSQDYPDKELIIVTRGSEIYKTGITDHIHSLDRNDINCVFLSSKVSLGAMRNIALSHASGQLICQWDDDDLNHPHRLKVQSQVMLNAKARASFFCDHFHLFRDTKQLYWCDWARSRWHPGHPGTLMAFKQALPPYNETQQRQEDSFVQHALIAQKVPIAIVCNVGYLYTYVYHGTNVFSRAHHERLARAYGLERDTLLNKSRLVLNALATYHIDSPLSIVDHMGREILSWSNKKPSITALEPDKPEIFVINGEPPIENKAIGLMPHDQLIQGAHE